MQTEQQPDVPLSSICTYSMTHTIFSVNGCQMRSEMCVCMRVYDKTLALFLTKKLHIHSHHFLIQKRQIDDGRSINRQEHILHDKTIQQCTFVCLYLSIIHTQFVHNHLINNPRAIPALLYTSWECISLRLKKQGPMWQRQVLPWQNLKRSLWK